MTLNAALPDMLANPVPDAMARLSASARIAGRFIFTGEATALADGDRYAFHVRGADAPWVQAACHLAAGQGGTMALHAAFGLDAMPVALPEDIPAQQEANAALEMALNEVFGPDAATPVDTLRHAWDRSLERLEARWAEIAAGEVSVERFLLRHWKVHSGERKFARELVLANSMTRIECTGVFGVQEKKPGSGSYVAFGSGGDDLVPLDQQNLAHLTGISGHRKLALLTGAKGPDHAVALAAFHARRFKTGASITVMPVTTPDAIAVKAATVHGIDIFGGTVGGGWLHVHDGAISPCVDLVDTRHDGGIEWKKGRKPRLMRSTGTPAPEERRRRRLIAILLAFDPVLPDWCAEEDTDFDPAHPLLSGLPPIPPRHQAFIHALLTAVFDTKRLDIRAFARKRAKKAIKESALADTVTQVADGAIFGKVARKGGYAAGIYLVRREEGRLGRGLYHCYEKTEGRVGALTPRNIVGHPLVSKPTALRLLHDAVIGGQRRDVIEGAFRLSFHLEPGARNPFLDRDADIDMLDIAKGISLRVTVIPPEDGHGLLALAVVGTDDRYTTDAALVIEVIGGERRFYLRPALKSDVAGHGPCLPLVHRDAIERGIVLTCPDEAMQAMALASLAREWKKLAKRYPEEPA